MTAHNNKRDQESEDDGSKEKGYDSLYIDINLTPIWSDHVERSRAT